MDLRIDPEELNACVQCGLCLPHCPTYRVTGDETRSPRGRIALMREVQDHDAPLTTEVVEAFDTCIQCRGCEPACPSGVPYGSMMESTRAAVADTQPVERSLRRLALAPLSHPSVLRAATRVVATPVLSRIVPDRLGLPADLPRSFPALSTTGDDVVLFTGCVMDAWQRQVHEATIRVYDAAGIGVTPSGDDAPCCGALHVHAGLTAAGEDRADQVAGALGGDRPIVVNSAGCGAAMKEYGRHSGDDGMAAFSARVFDAAEFLAPLVSRLPPTEPLPIRVAIQDPCHLRHVQRVHEATRVVVAPFVSELVELDDDGLCCGDGGAYSVLEPELAGAVRDRKVAAIGRAEPDLVVSANPGCSLHLTAAGVPAVHPFELIDAALRGHGDALLARAARPKETSS